MISNIYVLTRITPEQTRRIEACIATRDGLRPLPFPVRIRNLRYYNELIMVVLSRVRLGLGGLSSVPEFAGASSGLVWSGAGSSFGASASITSKS